MPAAAVIPAPIAYIKVVAVKKLVVGFLVRTQMSRLCVCSCVLPSFCNVLVLTYGRGLRDFYFEKIRVFQAGLLLEYFSME